MHPVPGYAVNDDRISTIIPDFGEAVTEALDYLTGIGHREIGFFTGKEYIGENHLYPDYRKKSLLITVMHTI